MNRAVLFWPEHWQQVLGAFGLALLSAGACSVPFVLGHGRRAGQVALVVLAAFAAGELRRLVLRREYRVELRATPASGASHLNTTRDLRIQHYALPLAAPLTKKLRLVQITDVHVTEQFPFDYYERLSALVASRKPDVLALTGDLLSRRERLPLLVRWLRTLPEAPLGRYAVLGNHEYWAHAEDEVRSALAAAHVSVIAGECRTLSDAGAPGGLRVCGTEAPWGPALKASALST
ncbi:MAG TPA: metallophosphoesterase, partial [Polyangiaceae bacterium]|nr:metallophosphoesterase [Polyangiaceae bacterium]